MMGKLRIILIITVCISCGRCENVTFPSINLTDYSDYEFSESDEMPVNVSIYSPMVVTVESSNDFLNDTSTSETEDIADGPTTPLVLIKPVMTLGTPKPGVAVLTYEHNDISTLMPVTEISESSTEFEDHTEILEVTSQATNDDVIDITSIQLRIEEIAQKLQNSSAKGDVDIIQEVRKDVAADLAILRDEIDLVLKGEEVVSKTLFDLQTRYLHLQKEMGKLNETLNTILQQEELKRVDIVLSLLNQNRTIEAAEEVSKMVDISNIRQIVDEFYKCNRENILDLIQFTHQLSNLDSPAANTQASTRQLISLLSLYTEMKSCNQTDDPGILEIKDMVVAIHALEEFPFIKHDAGVLMYDAFRDDVEKDARLVLTEWQNQMLKGEYRDIVKFALRSEIYSECLNNNMIRLVWAPISFETNNAFLKALPDLSNRVAGYSYLNTVYKNHHRYDEMIKLAVTVKSDFEKNLEDIDEYVLNDMRQQFWIPVRKLVWSESCVIKNRYTEKYLFEFMKVNGRGLATHSVETVRMEGGSLGTSNDFRWKFVPNDVVPGKFEIQNVEYLHSLEVEDTIDGSFKHWPRRTVKTSNLSSKENRTRQWAVILSDKDDVFSFKSDFGFLTGGKTSET
uniref:Uncharacterized protein n=2 Tax=Lygus hesperus TaxID=30085 RepID=A0A0K8T2F5_LYGHE